MRGSPVFRGVCVFLGVLAFAVPLRTLTREASSLRGPDAAGAVEGGGAERGVEQGQASRGQEKSKREASLEVVVDFSRPAKRLEILHLGHSVLTLEGPSMREERRLALEFPKEGLEFLVRASFDGEGTSAIRFRLKSPEGDLWDRSAWGTGVVEEVLAFP